MCFLCSTHRDLLRIYLYITPHSTSLQQYSRKVSHHAVYPQLILLIPCTHALCTLYLISSRVFAPKNTQTLVATSRPSNRRVTHVCTTYQRHRIQHDARQVQAAVVSAGSRHYRTLGTTDFPLLARTLQQSSADQTVHYTLSALHWVGSSGIGLLLPFRRLHLGRFQGNPQLSFK